jgi:tight adherence protein B
MAFDPVLLMIVGAAGAAGLAVLAMAGLFGGRERKKYSNRLDRVSARPAQVAKQSGEVVSLRSMQSDSGIHAFDRLIKQFLPRPAVLRGRLSRTGRRISVGEFVLFSLLVAAGSAFLTMQFLPSLPIAGLVGISCGLAMPHAIVNLLIGRRLKAFTAEFPQAIDLIVRGLKSGLPVPASIRSVAEEIKDPVGSEFALVADRLRIGQSLEDALHMTAQRVPTPEFHFFVTSLSVQRETGGNLAETLENLSDVLRQRRQMKMKIRAMSSEARASAMILGSLPFVMLGIMMVVNAGYVMQLFTDPRGMWFVGFGVVCLGIGFFVMAKMVRFDI